MDLQKLEQRAAKWEDSAARTIPGLPDAAPKYLHALAGIYFDLAIEHFTLRSPNDLIVKYLTLAGEYAVLEFEQMPPPIPKTIDPKTGYPKSGTNRNFYGLNQRVLGLVACWCDLPWRRRLRALPEWTYDWPSSAEDYAFILGKQETPPKKHFKYFRRYAQLALDLLGNGRYADADLNPLLAELEAGKGPKKEKEGEESLHGVRALRAIVVVDGSAFNTALEALLALHKRSATRGAYRTMNEGRICLNGMFLARMASEHGISVSAASDYLPLHLMDAKRG